MTDPGTTAVLADTDRFSALAAGSILFAVGPIAIILMPMIVGSYVEDLGFTVKEAGFLASAEATGMCLASIAALLWVVRVNWRLVAGLGIGLYIVANLAAIGIDSFMPMLCCRVLASFGSGTAFAVSVASLGNYRNPERAYACGAIVQSTLQIIAFALSPQIVQKWGADGMFLMLVVIALFVALSLPWLPAHGSRGTKRQHMDVAAGNGLNLVPVTVSLVASLLYFISVVGFWTYLERIGDAAGLSTTLIGFALAASMGFSLAGGAAAAWLSDRYGRVLPLSLATAGQVVVLVLLVGDIDATVFTAGATIFFTLWVFLNAYQMALVAVVDISGRFVVLVPAFQGAGAIIGPAVAALLIKDGSYLPVNIMAGFFAVASLVLFIYIVLRYTDRRLYRLAGNHGPV
ncbi:MAG: MFS transporter [Gammaproteobacteria bacterium]